MVDHFAEVKELNGKIGSVERILKAHKEGLAVYEAQLKELKSQRDKHRQWTLDDSKVKYGYDLANTESCKKNFECEKCDVKCRAYNNGFDAGVMKYINDRIDEKTENIEKSSNPKYGQKRGDVCEYYRGSYARGFCWGQKYAPECYRKGDNSECSEYNRGKKKVK